MAYRRLPASRSAKAAWAVVGGWGRLPVAAAEDGAAASAPTAVAARKALRFEAMTHPQVLCWKRTITVCMRSVTLGADLMTLG